MPRVWRAMIHLTSWPVTIVEYGLAVFCLLDVALMRERQVRWVPRFLWACSCCVPARRRLGRLDPRRPPVAPPQGHSDDLEPDGPARPR